MQWRNGLRHLRWAVPVLIGLTVLGWVFDGFSVGYKGMPVSGVIIGHDTRVLLKRAGAASVGIAYYDFGRYMSMPGSAGVAQARSASPGPASPPQLLEVGITQPGFSTAGHEQVAAEGAVRTWRYLSDRRTAFAVVGVLTRVTRSWGSDRGTCAYLSRERYQELMQAAEARGGAITVAELAAAVPAAVCPVDYRTLMTDDQTAPR